MRIETDFAESALEMALKGGAESADIFIKSRTGVSAESKGGEPESIKSSEDLAYAIRVFASGGTGLSYSTRKEDAAEVVRAALESARHTHKENGFTGAALPEGPFVYPEIDIYDPETARVDSKLVFEKAMQVEHGATSADPRIKNVRSAVASFSVSEVLIMNTKGVSGSYSATSASAQIMAVGSDGKDSQMGWDFQDSSYLADINFGEVGRMAAQRALELLGAGRTSPSKAPLVIDGPIMAELLEVFASMLSAEAVQKGKSLLAGKLGQKIISPMLNMIDDGLIARRPGSRPFDDEGVAASRKALIKNGVLQGYMHNSKTAARDKIKSTGNGVRPSIMSFPGVGPLNIYLESAAGAPVKKEELMSRAGNGVYVTSAMGMHTINPISGEFSIGISGLLIENGKAGRPVKEMVVSGNVLDLFANIIALGDDFRFYGEAGAASALAGPVDISA